MPREWSLILPLSVSLLTLGCDETGADGAVDSGVADTGTFDSGAEDTASQEDTGITLPDDLDPLHVVGAPWRGASEPLVTIVKYSDFQCPFCADANVTLVALLEDNPDVRLVYKHLPMTAYHEYAQLAAEASMAAFAQDADYFWAMHDVMFDHQDALTRADIEGYAEEIGVDMDLFRAALDDGTYVDIVQENADDAAHWEITSTPMFLINGVLLEGAQPAAMFQDIIDAERVATAALIDSGLTWENALSVRLETNLVAAEEQ